MDSASMTAMAKAIADEGLRVARFEFDYMAARRTDGRRVPPPRAEKLNPQYIAVVDALAAKGRLIIGGKSMGGRVASMLADELHAEGRVAGLLCLGYPFHPPGRPDQLRTRHLETLRTPALIAQGTRDPFGTREEVSAYRLSPTIEVAWFEDGDHDAGSRRHRQAGRAGRGEPVRHQVTGEDPDAVATHLGDRAVGVAIIHEPLSVRRETGGRRVLRTAHDPQHAVGGWVLGPHVQKHLAVAERVELGLPLGARRVRRDGLENPGFLVEQDARVVGGGTLGGGHLTLGSWREPGRRRSVLGVFAGMWVCSMWRTPAPGERAASSGRTKSLRSGKLVYSGGM